MTKLKHESEIFLCDIRARLQGFVIFFQNQLTQHVLFTLSGKREMGITKPCYLASPVLYIYNVKYACGTGRLYCSIYVTFILVIV